MAKYIIVIPDQDDKKKNTGLSGFIGTLLLIALIAVVVVLVAIFAIAEATVVIVGQLLSGLGMAIVYITWPWWFPLFSSMALSEMLDDTKIAHLAVSVAVLTISFSIHFLGLAILEEKIEKKINRTTSRMSPWSIFSVLLGLWFVLLTMIVYAFSAYYIHESGFGTFAIGSLEALSGSSDLGLEMSFGYIYEILEAFNKLAFRHIHRVI